MAEAVLNKGSAPRALALDALRGWAIITMCLSGVVPWGGLPSWMYHAQQVGTMGIHGLKYDLTVPGYTWVDLVFPAFLFSMGVAFPFALSSRLKKGVPMWQIVAGIFGRGASLVAFAIYARHIAPWDLSKEPTVWTHLTSLLAFAILFPIYMRLPDSWSKNAVWFTRSAGLVAACVLLSQLRCPDGTGFRVTRSDIILLVLSNMAVWGSLIWLLTRNNLIWRFGAMGLVAAAIWADKVPGSWVNTVFTPQLPAAVAAFCKENFGFSDLTWFYQFRFTKYLLVVLPGTIVGDLLMQWMKRSENADDHGRGSLPIGLLSIFCLLVVIWMHVGLHGRWVFATAISVIPLTALVHYYLSTLPTANKTDAFLKALFGWGAFWLALGLLCEPLEGGIKKDNSTMSYYFVSTGISIMILVCFTVWIDLYRKERWFWLLIANGQNPMLAYVGIRNLLAPVVNIIPVGATSLENWAFSVLGGEVVTRNGQVVADVWRYWRMFIWSLTKTLAFSTVVGLCTRFKIIWRS